MLSNDQLGAGMRPSVRQALRAYSADDATRAERQLTNLVRRLRDEHPGAAVSLEEGLDETLTVKRLQAAVAAGASPQDSLTGSAHRLMLTSHLVTLVLRLDVDSARGPDGLARGVGAALVPGT